MPTPSQIRPPQATKIQQCSNMPVAAMVSQQFVADPFATDFAVTPDKDRFQANTENGDVGASVTVAELTEGKPYIIDKVHADNTLTITFEDTTFNGSPTVVLGPGATGSVAFVRKGTTALPAFPTGTPGSSGLDSLGGTTVGKAVFTAVDAAAARTAIGAPAASAVVLKADTFTFGPIALDTIAANADAARWRPGFAGTATAMVIDLSKTAGLDGTVVVTPTIAGGATTPASAQHAALAVPGNIVDTAITNGGAFTADQEIVLAVSGTNTVAGKTMVTIEYTRT